MKIKRKKVAESVRAVFPLGDGCACPDCHEDLEDRALGCDTCHPLKQILHKGY